ncbi:MAG: hypothetical protein QM831_12560 [Kofleriaceae bacterium]
MSELAFNLNGDPFEIPPGAAGWRVRRMKAKGAPEVVYGRNGQPLVVPIDSDLDDVRAEVVIPGRYRFDIVDEANAPIKEATAGYAYIHDQAVATARTSALPAANDNIVIEAMRMNAEISKAVVDRFPQMLDAAANLLRAADGAGLPNRAPRLTEEEELEDEILGPPNSPAIEMINALVAQVVPLVVTGLANKGMPSLGSMFDWRKAAPIAEAKPALEETTSASKPKTTSLPPIDPKNMAHFIAIQAALSPSEAALARSLAGELSPVEVRAWLDELAPLSVPDAVAKIRATLADLGEGAES